jgi:hypothetical protein
VPEGHRTAERRSLALHRLVADRLDDAVLDRARGRIATLPSPYAERWRALLDGPREELLGVLLADDERARDLRQCTPFAGEVGAGDRWRIIREVR